MIKNKTASRVFAALVLVFCYASGAQAIQILPDTWYTFSTNAGGTTGGCSPADPSSSCIIPAGAVDVGTSPWTFDGAGTFEVLDMFTLVDQFQLFDFGALFGTTSAAGGGDCVDSIANCLADANASYGSFSLGVGSHSISIQNISGNTSGAHVFRLTAASVPEPTSLALIAIGLAGVVSLRRKKSA